MAILQNILYKVRSIGIHGSTSVEVNKLRIDSRMVAKGDVFIAVKGVHTDGHKFIEDAVEKGAKAMICLEMREWFNPEITYVKVADTAKACGTIADNFYDHPSTRLKLVGVTGSNGKTTITTLLFQLFRKQGYNCGLLSTVRNQVNDRVITATHTTPDALHFNELLAEMTKAGCQYVFAEISSHATHQQRIAGLHFAGGIFSNISHDHLDYHKTFEAYLRVKKSFFDNLPAEAFALSNTDDRNGKVMLQNTKAHKLTYGLKNMADYKGKILENNLTGLVMMLGKEEVHFRLTGTFNAYNLLAVYGAALALGEEKQMVLEKLSGLPGAEGRFELLLSPRTHVIGIVDYAHSPDALLNVLTTISELKEGKKAVITVVGCGGDRDKSKRPEMAQVAVRYSDKVVFTSDNPRSESPDAIIKDMQNGVTAGKQYKVLSITNRKEAIKAACGFAQPEDIVLVAGKGHEKYQEINGIKHPFDDKEVLSEMFKELKK